MVISTGTTLPACACVAALYCLQNSMMFTAWGPSAVPTGGAGVAWPAVSSILRTAVTLRRRVCWGGIGFPCSFSLQLLDLVEGQLDRGLATEDRHQHLDLLLVRVDLGDGARQLGEGAGDHGDGLADLPLDPRLELLHRLGLEDPGHFLLGERRRLGAGPHEPGDSGRVPHHVPGVVVQVHTDQEVAREHLARDHLLLAALDLHDVFHGDHDLEDLFLHVHGRDAALEVGFDLVLVSRVGVDDVPVSGAVVVSGLVGDDVLDTHGTPGDSLKGLATEDRQDELPERGIQPENYGGDHTHRDEHNHRVPGHGAAIRPVDLAQLGDDLAAEGPHAPQPRPPPGGCAVPGRLGGLLAGHLLLA